MVRIFAAIDIPEPIKRRLHAVSQSARKACPSASFVREENLHVTLVFLGEMSNGEIDAMRKRLASVGCGQFEITVGGLGFFPSESLPRVFWAGASSPELGGLHAKICDSLGVEPEKDFIGHVTLGRMRDAQSAAGLVGFAQNLPSPSFGSFTADSFSLKQSALTPRGAQYLDLARFSLRQ
ncbi:RNA 2',3'-cyclic phosphodiesterase [Candidatus Micrarchaeota archaeon]|nr:RNA 2',3'-cyclic phosphodiesterase [Candidatus Micrarchaeota archaeon]MBI5177486.1 RNA 2',3'-cyclic phosphodiesterase [Candidatus Micrarchaeota archaeon]